MIKVTCPDCNKATKTNKLPVICRGCHQVLIKDNSKNVKAVPKILYYP